MLEKIKNLVIVWFTLSLVISYCGCIGYFQFFNLDIASFLSIEDLILIFTRWTWLIVLLIVIIALYFDQLLSGEKENNWWDETLIKIKGTQFKRRALLILIIILGTIISSILYKTVADFLSKGFGMVCLIAILTAGFVTVYSTFKSVGSIDEIQSKQWASVLFISFYYVLVIPFVTGAIVAYNSGATPYSVEFIDGKTLSSSDTSSFKLAGKTADYFFLFNTKTKKSTAYTMEQVKSIHIESKMTK